MLAEPGGVLLHQPCVVAAAQLVVLGASDRDCVAAGLFRSLKAAGSVSQAFELLAKITGQSTGIYTHTWGGLMCPGALLVQYYAWAVDAVLLHQGVGHALTMRQLALQLLTCCWWLTGQRWCAARWAAARQAS